MSHKGVTELCVSVENKDWINLCLTLASAFPPHHHHHTHFGVHINILTGLCHPVISRMSWRGKKEEGESVTVLAGWENGWG